LTQATALARTWGNSFEPKFVYSRGCVSRQFMGARAAADAKPLSPETQESRFGHATRSEDLVEKVPDAANEAAAKGARPDANATGARATCGARGDSAQDRLQEASPTEAAGHRIEFVEGKLRGHCITIHARRHSSLLAD
jgi:hypothetical protein